MSYILLLAGWYPSRVDRLNGDFVQRHARAISLYEKVVVLFLVKDPSLSGTEVDVRISNEGMLTEYIIYYSARGPFGRGLSLIKFLQLGQRMVSRIKKEQGIPSLVHANVVWKAGLLALWLKRRYGWKYLLSEHWAGYTTQNPLGLHSRDRLERWLYGKVYAGSTLFLPVSKELASQVDKWFPGIPYEVVYNVADTHLFYFSNPQDETVLGTKKCIHVSTMSFQKNIEGILHVLEQLCTSREDVAVTLVGPYTDSIKQALADKGLLGKKVLLTGELPYEEVASLMRQSHFLFLFSRYENLPCVILEASCTGMPVIATRVGGIPEILDDSNGTLIDTEREDQLLEAMHTMLNNYTFYDRAGIARKAEQQFSYPVIGRQLSGIYQRYKGRQA